MPLLVLRSTHAMRNEIDRWSRTRRQEPKQPGRGDTPVEIFSPEKTRATKRSGTRYYLHRCVKIQKGEIALYEPVRPSIKYTRGACQPRSGTRKEVVDTTFKP
jgi:hypothetical protein